jgi:hypothetical protein
VLIAHTVPMERKGRLPFEARHTPDRVEFYNSDEFRRAGHVPWSPATSRDVSIMGVFHMLRTHDELYAMVSRPVSQKVLSESLEAATTILRMNMRFDAWTSMEVSDGYERRLGFFFRQAQDALMFKMVWPS